MCRYVKANQVVAESASSSINQRNEGSVQWCSKGKWWCGNKSQMLYRRVWGSIGRTAERWGLQAQPSASSMSLEQVGVACVEGEEPRAGRVHTGRQGEGVGKGKYNKRTWEGNQNQWGQGKVTKNPCMGRSGRKGRVGVGKGKGVGAGNKGEPGNCRKTVNPSQPPHCPIRRAGRSHVPNNTRGNTRTMGSTGEKKTGIRGGGKGEGEWQGVVWGPAQGTHTE